MGRAVGKVRVCGQTCHTARRPRCLCWCGGVFHGAHGVEAREAFRREFKVDDVPTTEAAFLDTSGQLEFWSQGRGQRWRAAIEAAHEARRATDRARRELGRRRRREPNAPPTTEASDHAAV
jgi:hypothetical protein